MRPLSAIGAVLLAVLLIACALPAASRAATAPAAAAAPMPAPGCQCPGLQHPHAWRRPHRKVRFHARYRRRWRRTRVAAIMPAPYRPAFAAYYNPLLPSPGDSAYNRAMVLHFRNPAVTGIYIDDPGYPATPPVVGIYPYRYQSGATVFQYDGITGQYIALSQYDARRDFPVPPVPLTH